MDPPKRWTSWLGGLAVAVTAGALCVCKAQDPDLGFHFVTGRAVLALGKVPGTNVLSYTHPDHPWLLHQWAPAVLFELVRRFAGEGVTVVKAVVATWLVSFVTMRRLFSRSVALGATLVVAGATAASFRFIERHRLAFTSPPRDAWTTRAVGAGRGGRGGEGHHAGRRTREDGPSCRYCEHELH